MPDISSWKIQDTVYNFVDKEVRSILSQYKIAFNTFTQKKTIDKKGKEYLESEQKYKYTITLDMTSVNNFFTLENLSCHIFLDNNFTSDTDAMTKKIEFNKILSSEASLIENSTTEIEIILKTQEALTHNLPIIIQLI